MFKTIKKNHRKTKSFHSSFLASTFASLIIGVFFSLVLKQNNLPVWDDNIISWIVWSFLTILFLYYYFRQKNYRDLKDKQNFYDNYFMSIYVLILTTLLILYSPMLLNWLYWSVTVLFIGVSLIILLFLYIKLRPRK